MPKDLTDDPSQGWFWLAPSQWETSLQSNAISHSLSANLESALCQHWLRQQPITWINGDQDLWCHMASLEWLNSLRPRQNGRLFADDTFKRIFLNENIIISTKNSLKFVPKGLINNIPALVLIMAWRRPGVKPLSEPMMVSLPTHICVTRPQWVKDVNPCSADLFWST